LPRLPVKGRKRISDKDLSRKLNSQGSSEESREHSDPLLLLLHLFAPLCSPLRCLERNRVVAGIPPPLPIPRLELPTPAGESLVETSFSELGEKVAARAGYFRHPQPFVVGSEDAPRWGVGNRREALAKRHLPANWVNEKGYDGYSLF